MRRLIEFALKATVSAVLLYFALAGVNTDVIGARLSDLRFVWMAGAVLLFVFQIVLLTVRWQRIAFACGATLTFVPAFRLSLIAVFFNQILPSTVGGDAMRVLLFARRGASWSQATYSVLLDRFVGVFALALLVVVSLPWSFALIHDSLGRSALLLIGCGSVGGALLFLALGSVPWGWLHRWPPTRHLTQMSLTARKLLFFSSAAMVMPISIAIHVVTAGIAWCAAHAVDASFGFMQALWLVPPVMLVATIPISIAGWGMREKSLVLAFAYSGLAEADGFLISVLLGVTMLVVGIAGGIVWLLGSDRFKADPIAPNEPGRPHQPPN